MDDKTINKLPYPRHIVKAAQHAAKHGLESASNQYHVSQKTLRLWCERMIKDAALARELKNLKTTPTTK